MKEYYEINKDWLLEHSKEYHKLNKVKILHQQNEYSKNKRINNPIYRLIENNRNRICNALQSKSKADRTIELLGCNKEFSYQWIKFLFPYDMSDDKFRNNYEIDHVVASANFDFSNEENQLIAFNWQNCRALLKSKNRSKGAKLDIWSEVMQELQVNVFLKQYYPEYC